ncbi:MAG: sugar ABC transporter permease [Anaerolineae bacterium]|nr:sugar ABC transporter permease [Anaerolineae bacterium]
MDTLRPSASPTQNKNNRLATFVQTLNRNKTPYLYIAPFFISFALFELYPLVFSVQLSFSDYKIGSQPVWTGLENYQRVLADPLFWLSLKNVLVLWLGSLPIQLVLGFSIAWLLNGVINPIRGLFSGILYLPVVTNLVAVALVFRLMFDDQYGIINVFLTFFGLPAADWMTSSHYAPLTTVILIIWKGLGWYVVYILAALQGVEKVYYEAAKIDGANSLQIIRHVTLPAIRPIVLFLMILGTIAGLQIFTEPYVLYSGSLGGPESSVLTPAMYIYAQGFKYLKFSNASAMAVVLGLIIISLSVIQFRYFSGRED